MLRNDFFFSIESSPTPRFASQRGDPASHNTMNQEAGTNLGAGQTRQAMLGTDEQDLWRPMEDWQAD